VVLRNLRYLTKVNKNASLTTVLASHEVKGSVFIKAVVKAITEVTETQKYSNLE
jgi:hypothetical protein